MRERAVKVVESDNKTLNERRRNLPAWIFFFLNKINKGVIFPHSTTRKHDLAETIEYSSEKLVSS